MVAIDHSVLFRIISFTLAAGDVAQTAPSTYSMYKRQWVNGTLAPVCFFYAMARYMSIISLIANGNGAFSTSFTPTSCARIYMLPNITALLAGMAVQVLVFIRTYAISGHSLRVWWGLGALMLLGFPVQTFGIVYHREMVNVKGGCKGVVLRPHEPDWNIVYYSAHMVFDLVACATATFYLIASSRVQGVFNASSFVRRVLRNGLLYTLAVFLANLWVVLEFSKVLRTGAASALPLAVVLIAIQHLILSTQRMDSDPSNSNDYSRSRSRPLSIAGLAGPMGPAHRFHSSGILTTQHDVELQPSASETYTHPDNCEAQYGSSCKNNNIPGPCPVDKGGSSVP
ncbi:hypothetical protein C8J57DRAFT_1287110 [Mycena rebaudengoi]|nr:hypothetical protein C8J57DRAFT_1287110 [Mycena rebaudengoi]